MTNHSGGGTPRTDAIAIISNSSQHYLSIVSLARQLERELNAALSLREREGWIPVSERLPETDKFVWVYGKHAMQVLACYTDGRFCCYDAEYDEAWTIDIHDKVTHWMPLPAPPAEKEKQGQRKETIRNAGPDHQKNLAASLRAFKQNSPPPSPRWRIRSGRSKD